MLYKATTTQGYLLAFIYSASYFLCLVDAQMRCNYFISPMKLTATSVIGTIQLPFEKGTDYLPNQHCEWMIKAEYPDYVIHVYIEKCSVQGYILHDECMRDYLDFFEENDAGKQRFLGRYCSGKCEGRLLETTMPHLMIHFVSDSYLEFSGFKLTYMAQPKKDKESTDDTSHALAVGIPVGLISVTLAIMIIVFFYRRWFTSKRSRSNPPSDSPSPAPCQHNRIPTREQQRQEGILHSQVQPGQRRILSSHELGGYAPHDTRPHSLQENLPPYSTLDVAPLQVDIPSNSDSRRRNSRPLSAAAYSMATDVTAISSGGDEGSGRSRTPPPSYELTMMQDRIMEQRDGGDAIVVPQDPPEYSSIVKNDETEDPDVESRV